MDTLVYCPYTNSDIPRSRSSKEHIIPLSLGGINGFEIPVDSTANSGIASKIDAIIAEDFFIKMKRNEYDVRGHSRTKPIFIAKKSIDEESGRPIQVGFDKSGKGLVLWDSIARKRISHPKTISSKIEIQLDWDIRFVAKVALSSGYFAYGNSFRENVDHEELRLIMNHSGEELMRIKPNIRTRVDQRFKELDNPKLEIVRYLCGSAKDSSIVVLLPSSASLAVYVGILGYYIGMVNVPAETKTFPNSGTYRLGHVICPQFGELKRISFDHALSLISKFRPKSNDIPSQQNLLDEQ